MFRYGALRWFGLDGYRITVSATIEPTPRNPPFHALATILAKIGCMTMGPGGARSTTIRCSRGVHSTAHSGLRCSAT